MDYPTKIKAAGLNGYTKSQASEPAPAKKTAVEIADEVLAGKWGNAESDECFGRDEAG